MQINKAALIPLAAAILLFVTAMGLQALPERTRAGVGLKEQPAPTPQVDIELENLRLQRERFEFDKKKAESDANREERKLEVENSKYWPSILAPAIPLIVGLIAIIAGFRSQYKQSKHQFELKAAEIVFTGTTPQAVLSRGKALKALFGDNLPEDFLNNFKPEDYNGDKETSEDKRYFLEQILKNPEKKSEITQLWFKTFPGDYKWLVRLYPEEFKDSDLPEIQKLLKGTPYEKKSKEVPPTK